MFSNASNVRTQVVNAAPSGGSGSPATGANFCGNCGTKAGGGKFCSNCGNQL